MDRDEVYETLNEVFRDVFDDPSITVDDSTTSDDVDGWDSLEHINLIAAIEQEFGFPVPRKHGYDTVASLQAMRDGTV